MEKGTSTGHQQTKHASTSPDGRFDTPLKTNYFLGLTLSMAWQLAAVFLLGFFGGHWLDLKLDKQPLFTVIGLALAVVAMILVIRRVLRQLNEFMKTGEINNSGDKS